MSDHTTYVAQILRVLANWLEAAPAAPDPAPSFDLGSLLERFAGTTPFTPEAERGGLYPTEDADENFGAAESHGAVVFNPHDLPLDKYEDCEEKEREGADPSRRQELRAAPLKWMTVAAYYCHLLSAETADPEDAARSLLMLPGPAATRVAAVTDDDNAAEYDDLWAECYVEVYRAHHTLPQRLDAVDYSQVLLALGEPCDDAAWSVVNRRLEALGLLPTVEATE